MVMIVVVVAALGAEAAAAAAADGDGDDGVGVDDVDEVIEAALDDGWQTGMPLTMPGWAAQSSLGLP